MSETPLGRGHRESKKTPGFLNFQADCDKGNSLSNTKMRNKRIREEEVQLLAEEEVQAKSVKKAKKLETASSKGKQKQNEVQGASEEEEAVNVAAVLKDEARSRELVLMIHICTGTPKEKLQTLDLDELEQSWADIAEAAQAESGPPAPTKASKTQAKTGKTQPQASGTNSKTGAQKPKPPTVKAKGSSTAAFETPAKKLTASKVVRNKVSLAGSPLVAFEEAQLQSARAALPTPVPVKRKLSESTGGGESVQRLCLDPPLPPAKPQLKAPAPPRPQASASAMKAGSRASNTPPVRSGSVALPAMEATGVGEDDDPRVEPDEMRSTSVGPKSKQRPAKKDHKDTTRGSIIDITVALAWMDLIPKMCAEPDDYALIITKAWSEAVKQLELQLQDYPLTSESNTIIRGLLSSNRSRGRRRVAEMLVSEFGLQASPELTLDGVKALAAALKPNKFHRDPNATAEKAGLYRHPFVSHAIATFWYIGSSRPGIRHPELFKPMPIEAVAFICGLSEDIISCIERDRQLKTEVKAKKGEGKGRKAGKKPKEEIVPRANLDTVKACMQIHLQNLQTFRTTLPGIYKRFEDSLHDDALKWVGKCLPEEEANRGLVAGAVTADAFADEVDIPIADVEDQERLDTPVAPKKTTTKPPQKSAPVPRRQLPTVPEGSGSDSSSDSDELDRSPKQRLVNPDTGHAFEPLDPSSDSVTGGEPSGSGNEQDGEEDEEQDGEDDKVGEEESDDKEVEEGNVAEEDVAEDDLVQEDVEEDDVEEERANTPTKEVERAESEEEEEEEPQTKDLGSTGNALANTHDEEDQKATRSQPKPNTPSSDPLSSPPPLAAPSKPLLPSHRATRSQTKASPVDLAVNARFAVGLERRKQEILAKVVEQKEQEKQEKKEAAAKLRADRAAEKKSAQAVAKEADAAGGEAVDVDAKPKRKRKGRNA